MRHAQADCRLLCGRVSGLPRELRDEIYSHLTYERQVYMASPFTEAKRKREYLSRSGKIQSALGITHLLPRKLPVLAINTQTPGHIWDAQYVGALFLQEMIDNWYRTATFCVRIAGKLDTTGVRLEKVELHATMKRISCLKIEIEDWCGRLGNHFTDAKDLSRIVDNVKLLAKGSRVHIYFRYFDGRCCPDDGQTTLEMHCGFVERVMPWFRKIEHAGYDVSLHVGKLEFKTVPGVSAPADWVQALKGKWAEECELVRRANEQMWLSRGF